jgi:hypothetical protein
MPTFVIFSIPRRTNGCQGHRVSHRRPKDTSLDSEMAEGGVSEEGKCPKTEVGTPRVTLSVSAALRGRARNAVRVSARCRNAARSLVWSANRRRSYSGDLQQTTTSWVLAGDRIHLFADVDRFGSSARCFEHGRRGALNENGVSKLAF